MVNNSKFIQYTFGNEPDDLEVLDFIHHQLMKVLMMCKLLFVLKYFKESKSEKATKTNC